MMQAATIASKVSTRAPARGATTRCLAVALRVVWSFNPRAREGRDGAELPDSVRPARFQPARPRGARPCRSSKYQGAAMFQPARPRGARRFRSTTPASPTGFNPRAREGRDEVGEPAQLHQREVSTRAPARGATKAGPIQSSTVCAFQPARPRGARLLSKTISVSAHMFQPARPRGARR